MWEKTREKIAKAICEPCLQAIHDDFAICDEPTRGVDKPCDKAFKLANKIHALYKQAGYVQLDEEQELPPLRGYYRLNEDCDAIPITELETKLQQELAQVTQQDMLNANFKKVK